MADLFDLRTIAARIRVPAIIDIGANDGAFAGYLSRTFACQRIVAFEPLPDRREQLLARGYEVHSVALSNRNGEAMLNISSADAASSLLPLTELCKAEFPQVATIDQLPVTVRRLDDLLGPIEGALVKIDAQGAELDILRGGQALIAAARLVLIEMTFKPLYAGQALFNDVHRELDRLGFDLAGFRTQTVSVTSGGPLFGHAVYEARGRA
jgi:FkbM family methyltransferase